ncbi:hypothetical protein A2U01_0092191, partial [Trifolium medium]|nr:hypothetical protein [Trifolium medium]
VLSPGLAQRATGDASQKISGILESNGEEWRLSRSATKTLAQRRMPRFEAQASKMALVTPKFISHHF